MINEEWPRSETARMMSLQASCDQLPTSLILVNDKKIIIGHCKLTPIPSIHESCFIETVVISKALRGRKLGSYLMKRVEEYCRDFLKLKMVHLSTKGQENFYSKLGYKLCDPVNIYGTCVTSKFIAPTVDITIQPVPAVKSSPSNGPLPPPPPPMPRNISVANTSIKTNKTFMCKYLS